MEETEKAERSVRAALNKPKSKGVMLKLDQQFERFLANTECAPEPRDRTPENRKPNPGIPDSKPEIRKSETLPRNPNPETRNQKSGNPIPEPQT